MEFQSTTLKIEQARAFYTGLRAIENSNPGTYKSGELKSYVLVLRQAGTRQLKLFPLQGIEHHKKVWPMIEALFQQILAMETGGLRGYGFCAFYDVDRQELSLLISQSTMLQREYYQSYLYAKDCSHYTIGARRLFYIDLMESSIIAYVNEWERCKKYREQLAYTAGDYANKKADTRMRQPL